MSLSSSGSILGIVAPLSGATTGAAAQTGGNGGAGKIIVTEYY